MGILGTVLKGGFSAVPAIWKYGAIAVGAISLLITAKVWFNHEVTKEANKQIAAYVLRQSNAENQLKEFNVINSQKLVIQYVDKIKTITKVVHDTTEVIKDVPDFKVVLSAGWINVYNASIDGVVPTDTEAKDATPSGITAGDALATSVENNGICTMNATELSKLQQWITDQKAEIAKINKKNGVH